jgi:tetratricopeptide (TPR) repeat protein
MESPNLDETRPTSSTPDEQNLLDPANHQDLVESSTDYAEDADVTQPVNVSRDEQSIGDTQLSQGSNDGLILPPEIPDEPAEAPKGNRRWILWAFLGVLLLALIAAGSAYAGYNSAIEQRTRYQSTTVAGEAANQYVLAQQDIALGNYDRARQRLEYIIQIDPNYPEASEQLANVLTQQRITASPTLAPTPTLTPTPDFRTRDELFAQAQNFLVGRDWTGSINTLLLLRKNYADYMAVKVDGMLFVALRNRGIDKIAKLYDLEGGNYDLTLAERFGPLDAEARNWRDWAELYIRGASFWGVDWGQSVYYFSQLANAAPNLSDISGWTASNRYLDALLGYGNWYSARGEWCDAQQQFDTYMTRLANPQVEPTAMYAADQCAQGAAAPETPSGEFTPTPETPVPTVTIQPNSTPYP